MCCELPSQWPNYGLSVSTVKCSVEVLVFQKPSLRHFECFEDAKKYIPASFDPGGRREFCEWQVKLHALDV